MKLSEIAQPKAVIDKADIINWLKSVGVKNYTIRDDGIVDVNGDVNLKSKGLQSIPIQFGHVSGYFTCVGCKLTSLTGAPQSVGGYFDCSYNKLTSLTGAPQSVGGYFGCAHNKLTSLTGAPQSVGGGFYCGYNKLTSLTGSPQSVGDYFNCVKNPHLKILPIFRIKGITRIDHEAGQILTKYYKPDGTGDIIAAQDELIDAGFGKIARMK